MSADLRQGGAIDLVERGRASFLKLAVPRVAGEILDAGMAKRPTIVSLFSASACFTLVIATVDVPKTEWLIGN